MSAKKRGKRKEGEYYDIVKEKLRELFEEKTVSYPNVKIHLEITANGIFSNELTSRIPSSRDIIFSFLKRRLAPDITGFIETPILPGFVVVEVKRGKIELDHLYQLKKYADLLDAKFAFLVSLKPIPEEIRRLSKVVHSLLTRPTIYERFALAQFDEYNGEFAEWFEKDPFAKSAYWNHILVSPKKDEILRLLKDCSEGLFVPPTPFEIEGEDGFIGQVKARGLTGDVWTHDMLEVCGKKLRLGYENYTLSPNAENFLDRVSKAMRLDEAQNEVLKSAFKKRDK